MAIRAVFCLSIILSGYATAFPSNWLAVIEGGRCASRYSSGCCNGSSTECIIRMRGMRSCYCDKGCHGRGDCCDDIAAIGCTAPPSAPTECADAELDPGNCQGYPYQCRTPQGCYCDSSCYTWCDCCHDVPNGCRRPNLLSIIQEQRKNYQKSYDDVNDVEMLERRLLHYLISSQNYRTRSNHLLAEAQFNEDDMETELLEALAEQDKEK